MWSVTYSWVIIQGDVADQIFRAPPYNLSPTSVGLLIGIAPLVGSAIGTILGSWMCDWVAQLMVKQNGGVSEPGFRLVVFVPTLITIFIGSFGLGMAITNGLSIWACAVFLGFLNFGVGVGCTGIVAYSNDVCQHRAADAFGVTTVSISSSNCYCIRATNKDISLACQECLCFWSHLYVERLLCQPWC